MKKDVLPDQWISGDTVVNTRTIRQQQYSCLQVIFWSDVVCLLIFFVCQNKTLWHMFAQRSLDRPVCRAICSEPPLFVFAVRLVEAKQMSSIAIRLRLDCAVANRSLLTIYVMTLNWKARINISIYMHINFVTEVLCKVFKTKSQQFIVTVSFRRNRCAME